MRTRLLLTLVILLAAGLALSDRLAAQTAPNDPELSRQRSYLNAVRAVDAWTVERGDPNVVVAVISSGVDTAHRDIAANVWRNPAPGASGCPDDLEGCNVSSSRGGRALCSEFSLSNAPNPDVRDETGLGTVLAGIAGAVTNNRYGIAGVAWNIRLMAVKVTGCGPFSSNALAAGISYAAGRGARVAIIGVGPTAGAIGGCVPATADVADAVRAAQTRGMLIVVGSGDRGVECVDGVGSLPGVVTVAAAVVDAEGRVERAVFSQLGPEVALAAPGINLVGPVPDGNCRFCDPSFFRLVNGTAPAAALVGGAAALLISRNPLLGPTEVRQLLTGGAARITGGQQWSGAGLLDVRRSLALVPSSFTGDVIREGQPDASISVSAVINGRVCAESTVRLENGRGRYTLTVPTAELTRGCGTPGAAVLLRVDTEILATARWQSGVQAVDLSAPSQAQPPSPSPSPTPSPTPAPTPRPTPLPTPAPTPMPSPEPQTQSNEAEPGALAQPSALVGARSRSGAQLIGAGLTTDVSEDLTTAGSFRTSFTAEDEQVVLWTNWGGRAERRTIGFVWSRPDGTVYRQVELEDQCPCIAATRWRLEDPGPNGGDTILESPGIWQIDIYADGEFIGAVQFNVE